MRGPYERSYESRRWVLDMTDDGGKARVAGDGKWVLDY
jgi:hypothetical protein